MPDEDPILTEYNRQRLWYQSLLENARTQEIQDSYQTIINEIDKQINWLEES